MPVSRYWRLLMEKRELQWQRRADLTSFSWIFSYRSSTAMRRPVGSKQIRNCGTSLSSPSRPMPYPATMRRRSRRDATAISPNRSARASFSPRCANSWGDAEGAVALRTPPRILVVDDNLTNLEVLRVRLNAHGYEVITAVDGEDALRRARELEPDLVLLDIMMPKLDGISVLKELKRDTALPFIPVILVTAKADTGDDDYLAKPFEQAALVARVRSMLRIKELHDTVQLQAAQLKEQTEQLSSWNRSLEERVAKQVAEIERVNRLRRFLAPQVAQMIASSDAPDSLLASHRREVTVMFCDLRGFTAFTEVSE